jgi:lysophospholipase L1-like esterase
MRYVGLFAAVLSLVGPPATRPAGRPGGELKIRPGEQIVAMGDSITQAGGYLTAIDAVFAQQYPDLKIPKIINVGIGGQKAENMVARFQKDVVERKPAIATISVGINDVWHRLKDPHDEKVLEAYTANLERMVKMAQDAGIRVYLLGPTVIEEDAGSEGNKRLAKYVAAGKKVAERNKCEYVDLHAMFLAAIKRHNRLESRKAAPATQPSKYFTRDGVHMQPPGDVLMAIGLLRALGVPDERMAATDLKKVFPKAGS